MGETVVMVDMAMVTVDAVGDAMGMVVAEASTTLVQVPQPREDCALPLAPVCLIMGRRPLPTR